MRRALAVLLGVAAMVYGARLMIKEASHNAACNSIAGHGARLVPLCQHMESSYLQSLGLITGGFIVMLFGVTVMKKRSMRGGRRRKQLLNA